MDAGRLLIDCAARGLGGDGGLDGLVALAREGGDPCSRHSFPQHVTASACIVDKARARVVMILSPKFGRWMLPGGHVDPGESPDAAALREFHEECGTAGEGVELAGPWPAHIDIHWIAANAKRGEPRHQHVDFQYIMVCSDPAGMDFQPDPREATEVAWREIDALRDGYPELYRVLADLS